MCVAKDVGGEAKKLKTFKVHSFGGSIVVHTRFGVLLVPSEIDCRFAKKIFYEAYKPCLSECFRKWNDFLHCYEECFADIFVVIVEDPNTALMLLNFVKSCLE